jgi:hypothetical protein
MFFVLLWAAILRSVLYEKRIMGATIFRNPVTHWAENIGSTTIRLELVELKN